MVVLADEIVLEVLFRIMLLGKWKFRDCARPDLRAGFFAGRRENRGFDGAHMAPLRTVGASQAMRSARGLMAQIRPAQSRLLLIHRSLQ
jgi:hypothetical protein